MANSRQQLLRRGFSITLALTVLGACSGGGRPATGLAISESRAGTADNFQLIGHNALRNRGMNSALAVFGDYAYIGSRTDGSPSHLTPGVQVVNIADPSAPEIVGQIALAEVDPNLLLGYTSRELRVWPQQELLMVIYFGCSALLHSCTALSDAGLQPFQQIAFFDLSGENAAQPRLVTSYQPSVTPHEMFFWVDPARPGRALIYFTSPNEDAASLLVTDISQWRNGVFSEVAQFGIVNEFSAEQSAGFDVRLHSIALSGDGTRTYLAHLGGGVLVVDSSDLAQALPDPQLRLITPIANRAFWNNQGAHTAVKVPGRAYAVATQEIYGAALNAAFGDALSGCPWGHMRIIDIRDETEPNILSEYRIAENELEFCNDVPALQDNFSSYASHNPTVLPDLAFVTWHSGGLQAVDISDPAKPVSAGAFIPEPNAFSITPDMALEPGSNGVIAWSYPIIRDGLIYFVDVRNGLYIVRYSGPGAQAVADIRFLEGTSNLGDAVALDQRRSNDRTGLSTP